VHIHPRSALDEFLVIACDGVWDMFSNEAMAAYVDEHGTMAREGTRQVRPEEEGKRGERRACTLTNDGSLRKVKVDACL
jgi:serine/threonine protein phosphatase PrpC